MLVKKNVIGKLEEEMSRQKEVQILRPNLIKREISRILNIIFPKKGEGKHLNLMIVWM